MKILQEFEALCQAGKDGELSVERIFSEEKVKNCHVIHSASFPVRVRHRDLVQIWKKIKLVKTSYEGCTGLFVSIIGLYRLSPCEQSKLEDSKFN